MKWERNSFRLDDFDSFYIILTSITFTYKLDGKDIYAYHLYHLSNINP